jgi:Protein of unknown function (DUF3307)
MMPLIQVLPVLILVAGLQFKHFICDGPLQTKEMVIAKGYYGSGLGLLHAGLHSVGTFIVFALSGLSMTVSVGLAVADFVIHYHVDYAKENIVRNAEWTTANAQFWWALSADQTIHHFTYLGLTAVSLMV